MEEAESDDEKHPNEWTVAQYPELKSRAYETVHAVMAFADQQKVKEKKGTAYVEPVTLPIHGTRRLRTF
jgi:hypothetical protein